MFAFTCFLFINYTVFGNLEDFLDSECSVNHQIKLQNQQRGVVPSGKGPKATQPVGGAVPSNALLSGEGIPLADLRNRGNIRNSLASRRALRGTRCCHHKKVFILERLNFDDWNGNMLTVRVTF